MCIRDRLIVPRTVKLVSVFVFTVAGHEVDHNSRGHHKHQREICYVSWRGFHYGKIRQSAGKHQALHHFFVQPPPSFLIIAYLQTFHDTILICMSILFYISLQKSSWSTNAAAEKRIVQSRQSQHIQNASLYHRAILVHHIHHYVKTISAYFYHLTGTRHTSFIKRHRTGSRRGRASGKTTASHWGILAIIFQSTATISGHIICHDFSAGPLPALRSDDNQNSYSPERTYPPSDSVNLGLPWLCNRKKIQLHTFLSSRLSYIWHRRAVCWFPVSYTHLTLPTKLEV